MRVLVRDIVFGHYEPPKNQFGDLCRRLHSVGDVCVLHLSMSLVLFEAVFQWVPRSTADYLVELVTVLCLQYRLDIQRDENEALKIALQTTLAAKEDDIRMYIDMMEEAKKAFIQGIHHVQRNLPHDWISSSSELLMPEFFCHEIVVQSSFSMFSSNSCYALFCYSKHSCFKHSLSE